MATYKVKFVVETEIDAENEKMAVDMVCDDIVEFYSIDKDYYTVEKVKE